MKADECRALALSLPEAVESAHVGHPDSRSREDLRDALVSQAELGNGQAHSRADSMERFYACLAKRLTRGAPPAPS